MLEMRTQAVTRRMILSRSLQNENANENYDIMLVVPLPKKSHSANEYSID